MTSPAVDEAGSAAGSPGYHRPAGSSRPRARRHRIAAALITGYVTAAIGATIAHVWLPVPTWLALHLLLLGAATTAVLVYSRHFAQALLHAPATDERPAAVRLAVLTGGVVIVLVGVSLDSGSGGNPAGVVTVSTGAAAVVGAIAWHVGSLVAMSRRSRLAGRLRVTVWYYVAAGSFLVIGATLGALMGTHAVPEGPTYEALHVAHAHANLLGWVGLTVLGTQFMLWPAVLRTRMADSAPRVAARVLVIAVAGLSVAVGGLLASSRTLALAGVAAYAAGVLISLEPLARIVRRRLPRGAAAWLLAGATSWLLVALVIDLVALAGRPIGDQTLDRLVPVLSIGVVAQVLTGALTFLLPVVIGGGPVGNRRLTTVLETGWPVRAVVGNVGVLLVLMPAGSVWRTAGWVAALVGFGSFAPLVGRGLFIGSTGTAPAASRGGRP